MPGTRNRVGIDADLIAKIPVEPALIDDLWAALESEDELDVGFGLFFLHELLRRPEFLKAIDPRSAHFAKKMRDLVTGGSSKLQAEAIPSFVAFRSFYPDFAAIMKELLSNSNVVVRRAALDFASFFLTKKDLKLLIEFKDDTQFDETLGNGGPLRYTMRDGALEQAERIAGKSFANGDCFETRDGAQISWRSWSSFLNWLG